MSERRAAYETREQILEQRRARYQHGFVYLIRAKGTTGVYKIGEATDPVKRQETQQKKHDYEIELLFSVEVKDKWLVENAIHEQFHRYRLAGEWFALPDDVVSGLSNLIKQVDAQL